MMITRVGVDIYRKRPQDLNQEEKQNRKDRALAETAALLVLQKKVNTIWQTTRPTHNEPRT